VAKVVVLKGMVKAKLPNGSLIDVKVDQSIPEGAILETAEKSFVKLIFIDKSQMNLGPNSQMIINSFPKKEAGIITLVKGQIRSQVTKDYMEIDDKSKSKLYIKTKTAAMGIRGTDFQINFNSENKNTVLITFEGKVAMANIDKNSREDKFDQGKLEKVVSSEKAVMVTHGQISAVNLNVSERAMTPTLLGSKQIDALKENETGIKESTDGDKKQFRNTLPPGVDSALFSNAAPVEQSKDKDHPAKSDPNGFFNSKTGEYKLPAGSIVDLTTGNLIPPPPNAAFDSNTNSYVVPESFGQIDKTTGEYKAPEGLKLGNDGKFVMVDANAYARSQVINKEEKKEVGDKVNDSKENAEKANPKGDETRVPASTDPEGGSIPADTTGPKGMAPPPVALELPVIFNTNTPEMKQFIETFSQPAIALPPPPPAMTDAQQAIVTDRAITTEIIRQTTVINPALVNPNSKVNFKFNVQ
jgi:hypothetical protein